MNAPLYCAIDAPHVARRGDGTAGPHRRHLDDRGRPQDHRTGQRSHGLRQHGHARCVPGEGARASSVMALIESWRLGGTRCKGASRRLVLIVDTRSGGLYAAMTTDAFHELGS
jgi:hypothetical protein